MHTKERQFLGQAHSGYKCLMPQGPRGRCTEQMIFGNHYVSPQLRGAVSLEEEKRRLLPFHVVYNQLVCIKQKTVSL